VHSQARRLRLIADMEPSTVYLMMTLIIGMCLGAVTAKIADDRAVPGEPVFWFIAGTFLALVALPAAIFLKSDPKLAERNELASGLSRKCPHCAEMVKVEALICRYCQRTLSAAAKRA
jgi:hypothetical protein